MRRRYGFQLLRSIPDIQVQSQSAARTKNVV
jgi:hypothetical protein